MSDFKSISDRIADRQPAPSRFTHFHQACQHFCAAYGCECDVCQICARRSANERMDAAYRARQKRPA